MRSANPHPARPTRNRLAAAIAIAIATGALLGTAGLLPASAAGATPRPARESSTALRTALRHDLSRYLTTRRKAEHISSWPR